MKSNNITRVNKKKNSSVVNNNIKKKCMYENPGHPRSFKSPADLWAKAEEYFNWSLNNPIMKSEFNAKIGKIINIPIAKPFTILGFIIYANISEQTWINYNSNNEVYKEYFEVATRIKQIIRTQKFDGASAGIYNANIIARDLGLKDSVDYTTAGKEINFTATETQKEIMAREYLAKLNKKQSEQSDCFSNSDNENSELKNDI